MNHLPLALLSAAAFAATAPHSHAVLLWMDNFNVPDAINDFDGAAMTGRLSGTEAANTKLQSFGFQQSISNNQLLLPQGGNGVRFGGESTRYD